MEQFGIDWEGPVRIEDADIVTVPETECPLLTSDRNELLTVVDPLAYSPAYGIDFFEQTLEFIFSKLSNRP